MLTGSLCAVAVGSIGYDSGTFAALVVVVVLSFFQVNFGYLYHKKSKYYDDIL